jgi:PAS domain S-box-containing protein
LETSPKEPAIPARAGKIELPWLVLAALLISTVIGGWQAARQQAAEAEQRFAEMAAEEREGLAQRLEAIRMAAASVAAFSASQSKADAAAWRQFVERLRIEPAAFPGLVALRQNAPGGGARLEWRVAEKSNSSRPWESVAVFVSTDPAQPALSMPMQPPDHATYYVMRVAVPERPEPTFVYALIDMAALLKGAASYAELNVSLVDGAASVSPAQGSGSAPARQITQPVRLLDREAAMRVVSTPALEQRLTSQAPRMVLLVGLVSCALLGGLIWLLTRLRSQAESLAQSMTRKLTEQTRFTEDLIEHNPNPIFRKDTRGRFVSVNRAWEELTGHARADVVGKLYADLMPVDIATANEVHDLALLASPEGRGTIETQLASARGKPIQAIVAKQVITGEDGRAEGLIGTITDVTQIKTLERELQAQREQQALVIRSSQQGVWDTSESKDSPPFFSDRFKEILGFEPGEFPETFDWREVLHEDDAPRFKAEMVRLFKHEIELFDVEARARRLLGDFVWVRARGIAQYSPDGRATRFTGSITDITDRKKAEVELTEANVRVLDAARAKEAFLATMSHEMRTPLNGVLGMTSLLAETSLDDEQRDHIRLIRASGDTLLRIIDDILDFSKIESGRMMLEAMPVELVPLVEEAFELVAERAREKRLALVFDLADNVPYYVLGDTTRLRQILLNLLANAIKFTERGHIALSITCRSTMDSRVRLEIAIADTGIGIPADRIGTLFQPFTQVDASTTRKYGGTGLGLAICKRLVNLMGGDIRVESVEGKGSLFIFHIITEPAKGPARGYMQRDVPDLAGKRLLLADANGLRRETQARRYQRWGLAVASAEPDAAAALLERETDIDIVIAEAVLESAQARRFAASVAAHDALRHAAGLEPAIVILASTLARADLAAEPPAALPRHDMFVVRPAGRMRMFDLISRAAQGQRQGDFAARPFTPDPVREWHYVPDRDPRAMTSAKLFNVSALNVLVAEDNEVNQRVIIGMLNNLGHRAQLVADGQSAVDAATAGTFDAILLDVQMPVMDGIEAMKRIRAAKGNACPPMIAMTAHALPGDREHYIAAGMDDYLSKPIRVSSLSAVLAKIAAGSSSSQAAAAEHPQRAKESAPVLPSVLDVDQLNDLRGLPAMPGEEVADDGAGGLIDLFRSQTIERLDIMSAKRHVEDWAGLAETAHSLRGAAASIGFPRVAVVCKDIEAHARTLAGNPGKMQRVAEATPTSVSELLVSLNSRVIEANVALDEWLASSPAQNRKSH